MASGAKKAAKAATKLGQRFVIAAKKEIDTFSKIIGNEVGAAGPGVEGLAATQEIVESAARIGAREGSQVKHFADLTKQSGKGAEELANGLRGAQGKVGKEFETHLERGLGGQGSFSASRPIPNSKIREFDGAVGKVWYEAKSGNYWTNNYGGKGFAKFKSDMGERLSIALENGKEYQVFSNTPITEEAKSWLAERGIKFLEILE